MEDSNSISKKNFALNVFASLAAAAIVWFFGQYLWPIFSQNHLKPDEEIPIPGDQTYKFVPCCEFEIEVDQVFNCRHESLSFTLFRTKEYGLNELTLWVTGTDIDEKIPLLAPIRRTISTSQNQTFDIYAFSINKDKGLVKIEITNCKNI